MVQDDETPKETESAGEVAAGPAVGAPAEPAPSVSAAPTAPTEIDEVDDADNAETADEAESASPLTSDWAMLAAAVALLAGAVWVVYGPAIRAPFFFDDRFSVVQNPSITQLWPLWGAPGVGGPLAPPQHSVTSGRPLVNFSLAINYRFGRLNPGGYHAVNMTLHVVAALLLWAIVGLALRLPYFGGKFDQAAGPLSLMVALVWALHPLQTEAVEYVSQRTELMVAVCYLATLYASLRYWAAPSSATRGAWLAAATLACAAGMACKEVMVTAPVVVLLFERAFVARSFRAALRSSWPLYLGLSLGWLVLLALNYGGPRSNSAGFHVGVDASAWWLTQAEVLVMYLKLAIWPWPLVIHYDMPYHASLATAWPWVAPVAILFVATLVLLWRNTAAGFLMAAALLILSPTLVVPIPTEIAAERRMYLPLAALVSLVIAGGYALAAALVRKPAALDEKPAVDGADESTGKTLIKATVISAIVLASVFAVVSFRRLSVYRDLLTLWEDTAKNQPKNALVLVSLGASLTGAGRYDDAIKALERAERLTPDSPALGIHKQLGTALFSAGRSNDAIKQLEQALALEPEAPGIQRVLGLALLNAGRSREAVEHLQRVAQALPNDAGIRDNLGVAQLNAGRQGEAIASFQEALRLNPDLIGAQANLGFAYAKADRPTEAIDAIERAIQMARAVGATDTVAQLDGWLQAYRKERPSP